MLIIAGCCLQCGRSVPQPAQDGVGGTGGATPSTASGGSDTDTSLGGIDGSHSEASTVTVSGVSSTTGSAITGGGGEGTTTMSGSDSAATGAGMAGDVPVVCGGVLCRALPNVSPDADFRCENGHCVVPPEGCVDGFAHCTDDLDSGCETSLGSDTACGACDSVCPPELPVCTLSGAQFGCASACVSQTPDFCSGCVNIQTNLEHCGACDTPCQSDFNQVRCVLGQCEHGECFPGAARCSNSDECESLNTQENCGACGRDACGAQNATPDCTNPDTCAPPVCDSGWANCDRTSPDCETAFGGGCTPSYVGTLHLEVESAPFVARASDSVTWLAGYFVSEVDLDPSASSDLHDGNGGSVYFSKLNADGSYAWSRRIGVNSAVGIARVAPGPVGSVLLTGVFAGTADFDPGPDVVELGDSGSFQQAYLACYSAEGEFLWARAWADGTRGQHVSMHQSDSVYFAGAFRGRTADIDPGPDVDERDAEHAITGFVVELDADGNYLWGATGGGEIGDIATSTTGDLWSTPASFAGGIASYPGGVEQTFWQNYQANQLSVNSGIVTASGRLSELFAPPGFPEERIILYPHVAGALLRMQVDGTYLGVSVLRDETFIGLAPAPGDGTVSLTATGSVLGYELDGTSAYRFQSGGGADTSAIVETADGFLLVGTLASPADMDPGPGNDLIEAGVFISEFQF